MSRNTDGKRGGRRALLFALLAANILLSAVNIAYTAAAGRKEAAGTDSAASPGTGDTALSENSFSQGTKYVLYIGTNDKDTYTQLIPTDDARDIVNGICAAHAGAYTALDAAGGWTDETGTLTQENTLIYLLYDVSEEELTEALDEILAALNQNSILVERADSVYTWYAED